MFGFVEFFVFVALPSGAHKRVMLAKIPCERHEAEDKLFEFRKVNEDSHCGLYAANIRAEFKFCERLDV